VAGAVNITGGAAVGTNQAGSTLTISAPTGTGTGTNSQVIIEADASGGTTGAAAHTSIPRLVLNGTAALTSGSAATLVTLTLASNSWAGGTIDYTIEVNDSTPHIQTLTGIVAYAATNVGGTKAGTTSVLGTEAKQLSSGTLTTTWAVTSGGLVQLTATTSLTPVIMRVTFNVNSMSQQAITVA
jgi:hypothetical protein